MIEISANLHHYTNFSFQDQTHYDLAQKALDAGIDVFLTTDRNVYVRDQDLYYNRAQKRVLCICGEEICIPRPEIQHRILVFNTETELCASYPTIDKMLDRIQDSGAIAIIPHPFDKENRLLNEKQFSWTQWENLSGCIGMEIFNLASEFKSRTQNHSRLSWYKKNVDASFLSADEYAVRRWDELLCNHQKFNAYAGSACPTSKIDNDSFNEVNTVCFSMLNNHLLIQEELNGDVSHDKKQVLEAIQRGRLFIGLDGIKDTKGFRFTAEGMKAIASQGEAIALQNGVTMKVRVPGEAICRVIHNGKVFKQWEKVTSVPFTVTEPGYYRVECYLPYRHELRGWIYSNPIYVIKGKK